MKEMTKESILRRLHAEVHVGGHIIGAAVGSGMTAKLAAMGGADLLLALSGGRFRIMGRSSFSSFFCYGSSNQMVMEMGCREIFPVVQNVPLLFGLMASDPYLKMYDYLQKIKENGFAGVVNSPTLALVDGTFRQALEEEGSSYDREVATIRLANHLGLLTMAFVTSPGEADKMIDARADMICVHLGLTTGGLLGAKRRLTINEAKDIAERVFCLCKERNPDILRLVYAGPANTLPDMQFLYSSTDCHGYIGGSTFDRIPMETAIFDTISSFKQYDRSEALKDLQERKWGSHRLVESIRCYIEEHYMSEIQLGDLALVAHMSASYLGARFKKEMGMSFTEYLLRFRLSKAKALLSAAEDIQCKEVAQRVGYTDYVQFSKMFRKYVGESPREYQHKQGKRQ
ncbi:MAG: phosphoenolpyruvate hydrolase family protein [Selenomonadaceae bacterium]|nr:phosphoenolpyruvate hydrolase family protein [Selenomonadaceae bacterium]MBQ1510687.1 phosphoenolpyruvate hydrolase family protein [Selenomonadaceae bacterium]MBQ1914341.1 phosphoenolpyruvate hydrolase family protein [Selenomonadaceae bacterium]MBQ3971365.1 phosphoenolpyruvate hydrolase family protein [Selenomonadaceae bacterium]